MDNNAPLSKTKTKVAIIGAGLAGLTAGYRLHQKGYDFDIYEAQPRVGGRVLTVHLKNYQNQYSTTELGGQNIADGGKAVNLFNLIKETKLEVESKIVQLSSIVYSNKEYYYLDKLLAQHNLKENTVDSIASESHSISELIDRLFPKESPLKTAVTSIQTLYEGLHTTEQPIKHNIETLKHILNGGISSTHKSMKNLKIQTIKGGNAKLPLALANILKERLQLDKVLTAVTYENDKIKLEFNNNKFVYCDKLIISVPASVYKDIKFDPAIIPTHQLQHIKNIHYGKIYKALIPLESKLRSHSSIISSQQASLFNFDEDVLVMFCLNNNYTTRVKMLKKEMQIIQNTNQGIRFNIQQPAQAANLQFAQYDQAVEYSWTSNPYARGSYSGYGTATENILDKKNHYNGIKFMEIFKPVKDRIFFIGEHTSIRNEIRGTLEAAVESAERAMKLF